jgi:hypothetical protein
MDAGGKGTVKHCGLKAGAIRSTAVPTFAHFRRNMDVLFSGDWMVSHDQNYGFLYDQDNCGD